MKFINLFFNKTPLFIAVEKECMEIFKFLLSNDKIDPNVLCVLHFL